MIEQKTPSIKYCSITEMGNFNYYYEKYLCDIITKEIFYSVRRNKFKNRFIRIDETKKLGSLK